MYRSAIADNRSEAEKALSRRVSEMRADKILFLNPTPEVFDELRRGKIFEPQKWLYINDVCTKSIPVIRSLIINNMPKEIKVVAICNEPVVIQREIPVLLLEDEKNDRMIGISFIPSESRLVVSVEVTNPMEFAATQTLSHFGNRVENAFSVLKAAKDNLLRQFE